MRALFWGNDEQWTVVESHLPRNEPGARRVDGRVVISGILHVLKMGLSRTFGAPAIGDR